ncbi:MAG: site-2 protease family protein [Acidobacteriota bacterium]
MIRDVNLGGIDVSVVLMTLAVLFFSLSLHESAHAWTADWLGDPTARHQGRVTLNPVRHIDPMGTIVFPLLGLYLGGFIFGWARPVPVNTARLKNPRKDHLLIAAAGPASNIVMAVMFGIGVKMITSAMDPLALRDHGWIYPLFLMCETGLVLNVILAVFNLFPIPPLDGSWILAGVLPSNLATVLDRIRPYSLILLVVLLMSGVFETVLRPILLWVRRLSL